MSDNKSLVAKLAEACDAVGGIEKKGTNQKQNYKYVRAADVAMAFRHELFQRGVLLVADEKECTELSPITTQSGGQLRVTQLKVEYTLRDSDSADVITASAFGIGMDSGDKGVYKAKTGALKYFLRTLGLIPDEVEPENDADEPTFQKQPDGSFAKNQPVKVSGAGQTPTKSGGSSASNSPQLSEPKKPATRKKAEASDYQPWGGVAGAKPKQTDFPHGHNLPTPEQAQTAQQTAPASPNAITPENPITDADVPFPGDDKKDREPTEAERKVFLDKLIALKNKGYQGIREYILKETGVARTNDIGFNKMTELVARLESEDKNGTLKQLLSN